MIEDQDITGRISSYSCCMGSAMYMRLRALRDGDTKKADALLQKALLLHWAIRVLKGYTLSDNKCKGEIPSTEEDVECAMKLADPCCPEPCGCCVEVEDPALSCDIATDGTAGMAVIASARLELEGAVPTDGDTYLVTGGTDSLWVPGTIQTWDGDSSVWVVTTLSDGDVIDVDGVLWLVTATGAVMYFPAYNMQLVDANGTYQFSPFDPTITASQHRAVLIQTYHTSWLTVYETTEDILYAGLSMAFGMLPFSSARVVYQWGQGCTMPVVVPVIIPPQLACGTVTTSITTTTDATEGTFGFTVNISDVDGFLLGDIILVYDGSTTSYTSVVGDNTFGPYPIDSSVHVTLGNSNSPTCDIDLGTQTVSATGCLIPLQQANPVDASYQGSALPDVLYFITSDVTSAGNTWATYVGFTVINSVYTLVPVGGEVQIGGTPDTRIIWDGVNMLPFTPQMHGTYTDSTFMFVSQYPGVHALRSRNALVEMHSDANGWFTVYNGPEVELASSQDVPYNSLVSVVDTIRVTYTWGGCSVQVQGDDIVAYIGLWLEYASDPAQRFRALALAPATNISLKSLSGGANQIKPSGVFPILDFDFDPGTGKWLVQSSKADGTPLSTLNIAYITKAKDVSMLRLLGMVTLSINGLTDTVTLPKMEFASSLTSLDVTDAPMLTSLGDLSDATALTSLQLSLLPSMVNRDSIEAITTLQSLAIFNVKLMQDLPRLSVLTAVKNVQLFLDYANGPLNNTTVLPDLNAALENLYVRNYALVTAMPDMSAAPVLNTLTLLEMKGLTQYPDLRSNASMATLTLSGSDHATSFGDLSSCVAITTLTLASSPLVTAAPNLSALVLLKTLNISGVPLMSSMPALVTNTNVETLTINPGVAGAMAFPSLTTLTKLKTLTLGGSGATAVPNMAGCVALETVTLSLLPSVTDFTGLQAATWVKKLSLYNVPSAGLADLTAFNALTDLDIAGTMNLPSMSPTASVNLTLSTVVVSAVGTMPKLTGINVGPTRTFSANTTVVNAMIDALDDTLTGRTAHFGPSAGVSELSKASGPQLAKVNTLITTMGWNIW